jgi:Tfp pilus assembly pilus retraction ATPase PilT
MPPLIRVMATSDELMSNQWITKTFMASFMKPLTTSNAKITNNSWSLTFPLKYLAWHVSESVLLPRAIPSTALNMKQLGVGKVFEDISNTPRGLIAVTGPTGSGKSTTMAAMSDYINSTKYEHILTIEDPIEFVHESKKSLIN